MKKPFGSVAIGPYSPALEVNSTLYLSGQIAPDSMRVNSFEEEVQGVFHQLESLLTASGYCFDDILKCTVYLVDFSNFDIMNDVYSTYFKKTKPTRTTIGVTSLPKKANIEIDAIAMKASS